MLQAEQGDDRDEADDDERVASVPYAIAGRSSPMPASSKTIIPGLTRYLSTFWIPAMIAGIAFGYCGATEKKNP